MSKIKMKIVDYDIESNSIVVAFASDQSKNPIDCYATCAYQPTMFDNPNDPEKVFEEIARAGISIAAQQDKEDTFKADKILERQYKQFVGKEIEYDVDTLLENANQEIEVQNNISIVEEILDEIPLADDN